MRQPGQSARGRGRWPCVAPPGWLACDGATAFPRLGRGCTGTWCGRGDRYHNKTGAVGCRIALRSPPCSLRGFATLSIPRWYAGEGASISIKALHLTAYSLVSLRGDVGTSP